MPHHAFVLKDEHEKLGATFDQIASSAAVTGLNLAWSITSCHDLRTDHLAPTSPPGICAHSRDWPNSGDHSPLDHNGFQGDDLADVFKSLSPAW